MVLKFVEQDPAYRALMEAALGELMPVVEPATGAMLKMEAFIFISSPGAVTPFHFDPEHNILLQLRGNKVMTLFPAADEAVVAGPVHEAFHLGGHRNLPYSDGDRGEGAAVRAGAGRCRLCAGEGAALGEERRCAVDLLLDHLAIRMELSRGGCARDERAAAAGRAQPGARRRATRRATRPSRSRGGRYRKARRMVQRKA